MINTANNKIVPIPYKHQIMASNFVNPLDAFALFMEQGTGKTKVVIDKTYKLYREGKVNSLVVICPNSITDQWLFEELAIHYPEAYTGLIWDGFKTNKSREEFYEVIQNEKMLRVFIINVEAFQSNTIIEHIRLFCSLTKPFIVVDESTSIKNPDAKRTVKIVDGFRVRKYKCILTGTPTPNSPFDLYSQFRFLRPGYWGGMSYFHFTHRYALLLTEKNRYTDKNYYPVIDEVIFKRIKAFIRKNELNEFTLNEASVRYKTSIKNITFINTLTEYYPYKNLSELNKKINPITFKVMKKDCLDLPDKVHERLYVELSKDQKRLYKSLQKELSATYNGKVLEVKDKLIMAMRLHMITAGLFPYGVEKIKKIIDNDGLVYEQAQLNYEYDFIEDSNKIKVLIEDLDGVSNATQIIIWSNFVGGLLTVLDKLKDKGIKVQAYYGGTPKKDRKQIIDDFKSGKIRMLVMNPTVGGVGLNLQCSTLHYIYSKGYKADANLQAEDRSHRIGQTNKVTYKGLVCKGTIDEKIERANELKVNLIDYFRDATLNDIIY